MRTVNFEDGDLIGTKSFWGMLAVGSGSALARPNTRNWQDPNKQDGSA